jgi:transcriptional regulator with XRE-family HTH domain
MNKNKITLLIKQRGYSLKEIAQGVGVSRRTLSNYLAGRRSMPHEVLEGIATLLGCSTFELGLRSPELDLEELRLCFEQEMILRWELYHSAGGLRAQMGLSYFLEEINHIARVTGEVPWNRLLSLGYQLEACIFRDQMRYPEAHQAHRMSLEIARAIGDRGLMAAALTRRAISFIQQGKAKEALSLCQAALQELRDVPCKLQCYTLQALSEAQARLGEEEALRTLDHALLLEQGRDNLTLTRCSSVSLQAQRAVNECLLGRYRQVLDWLPGTLDLYDRTLLRGRSRLLLVQAEAYLREGELEACAASVKEAYLLARSIQSRKNLVSLQEFVKSLHRWRGAKEINALLETVPCN